MTKILENGVARSTSERSALRLRLGRALGVTVMLALAAGGAGPRAEAQTCIPATTPCQVCPPPPCVSSGQSCGGTPLNITVEANLTCTGSMPQTTVFVRTVVGPGTVCYGDQNAQSCDLAAADQAVVTEVDTITAAAVLVPTLSLWGLVALVALLGALALRRLGTVGAPAADRQT